MASGLRLMVVCLLVVAVSGCVAVYDPVGAPGYRSAPPPHAPAYGARAKHRYHYHPDAAVYFDLDRTLYFYLVDGRWVVNATLPHALRLRLGQSVVLELETERPYERYEKHRKQYPPGQLKKKPKKKEHWKDRYD